MLHRIIVTLSAVLILSVASVGGAIAGENDELLKKIEQLERQLQELKQIQMSSGEKMEQCMAATGVKKLCDCLADKLPTDLTFEQYVHNVVTGKQDLGYDTMPAEKRKNVDLSIAARDACVEKEKEKGGFLW